MRLLTPKNAETKLRARRNEAEGLIRRTAEAHQKEVERLNAFRLEALGEKNRLLNSIEEEIKAKQAEKRQAQNEVEALERRRKIALTPIENEIKTLESDRRTTRDLKLELEKERERFVSDTRKANQRLRERERELDEQASRIASENSDLSRRLEYVKNAERASEGLVERTERQARELNTKMDERERRISAREKEIATQEKSLEAERKRLASLEQELGKRKTLLESQEAVGKPSKRL